MWPSPAKPSSKDDDGPASRRDCGRSDLAPSVKWPSPAKPSLKGDGGSTVLAGLRSFGPRVVGQVAAPAIWRQGNRGRRRPVARWSIGPRVVVRSAKTTRRRSLPQGCAHPSAIAVSAGVGSPGRLGVQMDLDAATDWDLHGDRGDAGGAGCAPGSGSGTRRRRHGCGVRRAGRRPIVGSPDRVPGLRHHPPPPPSFRPSGAARPPTEPQPRRLPPLRPRSGREPSRRGRRGRSCCRHRHGSPPGRPRRGPGRAGG